MEEGELSYAHRLRNLADGSGMGSWAARRSSPGFIPRSPRSALDPLPGQSLHLLHRVRSDLLVDGDQAGERVVTKPLTQPLHVAFEEYRAGQRRESTQARDD